MSIKTALTKIIPLLLKPVFVLLKILLYRPFVALYYLIFRIKKYNLGNQSKFELFRKKSFHFIAFFFVVLALLFNLQSRKPASAALGKQKVSVMEEIVRDEFDDSGQNYSELVQENAQMDSWQMLSENNYIDENNFINDVPGLDVEDEIFTENNLTYYDNDSLIKPKQIITSNENQTSSNDSTNAITERKEIIKYTIESGDTISTIARNFGLNVNTILWANNLNSFSIIRPGNELIILPTNGFLYKVKSGDNLGKLAQSYDTSIEKIIASNNLNSNASIQIGQELIIPGTRRTVTTPSTSVASSKTNTSGTGINVIKDIVSASTPIVSSNKMFWPTTGHRITQYFSWSHNGLDIGDKVGTAIYAADSGTVEISQGGWNGGYGNTILINHGGGKKTRYGHMSKLLVSKGESVEKGQLIGLMGSTGRSTGSHLHFEVVINGTRYNPLNYIR